jgi:5-methylcytosine-specific restriction endonuclease McrA
VPLTKKEIKRRYALRHPDRVKAQAKRHNAAYRAKHRDELNQACRDWYYANKEHANAQAAKWKAAHPDRVRELSRKYRERRAPEYFRALSRKSYRKNHAVITESRKRARSEGRYRHFRYERRAKLRSAKGKTSHALLEQKLAYYGNRCRYCRIVLEGDVTFDHAIPLSRGGSNWTANLLPACRSCNSSKNIKTFAEFIGRAA